MPRYTNYRRYKSSSKLRRMRKKLIDSSVCFAVPTIAMVMLLISCSANRQSCNSQQPIPVTIIDLNDKKPIVAIETWRIIGAFPLPPDRQIYTEKGEKEAFARDYLRQVHGLEVPLVLPAPSSRVNIDFTHDIYDDISLTGDKSGKFLNQDQTFPGSIVSSQALFWHSFETYKVLYAAATLASDRDTDAAFILSGNSPTSVWLNNEQVMRPRTGSVGHDPDVRAISHIHLRRGLNTVLVKEFCFPLRNNFVLRVALSARAAVFVDEHTGLPDVLDQVLVAPGQPLLISDNLRFFATDKNKIVRVYIRNLQGNAVSTSSIDMTSHIEVPTVGLPDGAYSIHLSIGQHRFSETFYVGTIDHLLGRYQNYCRGHSMSHDICDPCVMVGPLKQLIDGAGATRRLDKDLPIIMLISQIEWRMHSITAETSDLVLPRFHLMGFRSAGDGQIHYYYLHLPSNHKVNRSVPLVVVITSHPDRHPFLNAAPTTAIDALRRFAYQADRFGYAVLVPFLRGSHDGPLARFDILSSLKDVEFHYSIDERRIYLNGDCEDGRDALLMAERYPDRFAAVSIGRGLTGVDIKSRTYLRDVGNPLLYIANLRNMPLRLVHGEYFPHSPTIQALTFREQSRRIGKDVDLILLPRDGELMEKDMTGLEFEFFKEKSLSDPPISMTLVTRQLKFNSSYWLQIDRFDKYMAAGSIDAIFSLPNKLEMKTSNISRLTVLPDKFPLAFTRLRSLLISVNGLYRRVPIVARSPISLNILPVPDVRSVKHFKSQRIEGPISEAFAERFIVIQGTGGRPWQQYEAQRLVNEISSAWTETYSQKCRQALDRDVNMQIIRDSNLVLVGKIGASTALKYARKLVPLTMTTAGMKIGDRKISGTHLIGTTIYPNPLNPLRYIVVVDFNTNGSLPESNLAGSGKYDTKVWDIAAPAEPVIMNQGYWDSTWSHLLSAMPLGADNQ